MRVRAYVRSIHSACIHVTMMSRGYVRGHAYCSYNNLVQILAVVRFDPCYCIHHHVVSSFITLNLLSREALSSPPPQTRDNTDTSNSQCRTAHCRCTGSGSRDTTSYYRTDRTRVSCSCKRHDCSFPFHCSRLYTCLGRRCRTLSRAILPRSRILSAHKLHCPSSSLDKGTRRVPNSLCQCT